MIPKRAPRKLRMELVGWAGILEKLARRYRYSRVADDKGPEHLVLVSLVSHADRVVRSAAQDRDIEKVLPHEEERDGQVGRLRENEPGSKPGKGIQELNGKAGANSSPVVKLALAFHEPRRLRSTSAPPMVEENIVVGASGWGAR